MSAKPPQLTYAGAGVDVPRAMTAVERIKPHAARTHDAAVIGGIGPFAAAIDLEMVMAELDIKHPVMLQSVDGPGTIPILARLARDGADCRHFRTLGYNVAMHCFCDLACGGGRPITLLDNISSTDMDGDIIEAIVAGMADACEEAGCRLTGGELAQLPKVIVPGEYDFCACVTGLVERSQWINPQSRIRPDQKLVGFEAFCPNLNGLSLVRKIVFDLLGMSITDIVNATGKSVADTFIQPQPNYARVIVEQLKQGVDVIAASHITGGGLPDNIVRNLPQGCHARITMKSWPRPALFSWLMRKGNVSLEAARQTWNLGIGFVQVVAGMDEANQVIGLVNEALGIRAWVIGSIEHAVEFV